jgi:hypothetical protein
MGQPPREGRALFSVRLELWRSTRMEGDQILSLAKTPHEAILVHVTCYTASLFVIDFTCALDFGEAHG